LKYCNPIGQNIISNTILWLRKRNNLPNVLVLKEEFNLASESINKIKSGCISIILKTVHYFIKIKRADMKTSDKF
jgi:hypothetical protein